MADDATATDELEPTDDDLAQVLVLRDGNGPADAVENTDENRARARTEAARRRALFLHMVKGAQVRAGQLPRALTATMAAGATNLMLAEILHGNVVPTTAKEAAEVAKITHGIAKDMHGEPDAKDLTPEERAKKLATAQKLAETLQQRAAAASAEDADVALGGAPREGEVAPDVTLDDEWALDDDEPVPDPDDA